MAVTRLPIKRGVALAVAARTDDDSPYTSNEIVNNLGYQGLILTVMATDEVATSTLDIKLQAYDEIHDEWYDMAGCSFAQITANASTPVDLVVHPAITAVANRAVSQVLRPRMRCYVEVGDAAGDSFTFGIEYTLTP